MCWNDGEPAALPHAAGAAALGCRCSTAAGNCSSGGCGSADCFGAVLKAGSCCEALDGGGMTDADNAGGSCKACVVDATAVSG